jgi:hypothetical protein
MLSILLFNLIKFSGSIQVVNATRSFTPSEEENKREGKDKKKKRGTNIGKIKDFFFKLAQ